MSLQKIVFLTAVFCFCFGQQHTFAQQNTDVLLLKNNTKLYGQLDSIKRDTVYFNINGKIPVNYAMSEVAEIKQNDGDIANNNSDIKKPKLQLSSPSRTGKSVVDTSLLYMGFSNGFSLRGLAPKFSIGLHVNRFIIPQLSAGFSQYMQANGSFANVEAGFTGLFKKGWRSPYYWVQAGYGFNNTSSQTWGELDLVGKSGGFKTDAGLGMLYTVKDADFKWRWGFNLATQKAQFKYHRNIWNGNNNQLVLVKEDILYVRLFLTLGLVF